MYCLLTRNLSRQCFYFEALHVALFKYLTHLGLQTSNHGPCCAASSFSCAKGNAQHCCYCCSVCGWGVGGGGEGDSETSQNFSYKKCVAFIPCKPKFKGNNCIMHILCPLAQLYTFECMFFGYHFLTVTNDYDHKPCVSIQMLHYDPLYTTTYSVDALLSGVALPFRDLCQQTPNITHFVSVIQKIYTA